MRDITSKIYDRPAEIPTAKETQNLTATQDSARPQAKVYQDVSEIKKPPAPKPQKATDLSHELSTSKQLEAYHELITPLANEDHVKILDPGVVRDQLDLAKNDADNIYANRGLLSKTRDALSFIFGKSDATKAYEKFNEAHSLVKAPYESVDKIEQAFGSGVKLTDEQKKQWVSLLNKLPSTERANFIENLKTQTASEQPASATFMTAHGDCLATLLESGKPGEITPVKNLLMDLVESKIRVNTQFASEYLPKQFMSEPDRTADDELNREPGPINSARTFIDALSDSDSRKARFNDMIKEGNMAEFERGTNMEIASGDTPGVSIDRLYGIKRTPEGFTSVLGLGQGDRHAVGIDKMPWPHKTNTEQNAAIMKILRSTEKASTTDGKVAAFEIAYNKDNNYKLEAAQKEELKNAILKFAQARETRLTDQWAAIKTKESLH